jgi:hypothetical protein
VKPCPFVALGTAFTIGGAAMLRAVELKHLESQNQRDRPAENAFRVASAVATSTVSATISEAFESVRNLNDGGNGNWAHVAAVRIMHELASRRASVLVPRSTSHA